ncbi:hypothetical protein [Brevibacterium spongiae]|uniref:Uncharacterized protein n=1 Tax=Brevibacterium spongiae TaxID=2909672 RepID=A0ABY5SKG9_9MICO|nr:hypothetical protein [Brevibacterium spongiae]UVI34451.1 hypothetical protein L1F31_09860 [Brevibacterium spongiae]
MSIQLSQARDDEQAKEEGTTVSDGAKPVVDAAVAAEVEEPPTWAQNRGIDLAEVAAGTVGARRFIARIGLAVPVLLILATVAVASALGQPLRGGVDLGELGLWALGTALLLTPFLAALIVMLNARRGGLIWTTALVYSGLSGMIGLCVGIKLVGSEVSAVSLELISVLVVQVIVLAPVCAAVAFLVRIVRSSTGHRTS